MSWITLTPADLSATLLAQEVAALSNYSLAAGAADPVAAALADTTGEVRGYIAARAGEMVGTDGTLPSELKATALAIARWRLLTRLAAGRAAQLLLTDARRRDYEDAIARLKDVASGKFFVSPPTTPAAQQPRPIAGGAFGQFPGAGTTPGTPEPFNY
jgi:phage gp36-like protein